MAIISKKEAILQLGIDEKTFDNYFRIGGEVPCLPRIGNGRFKFDDKVLNNWKLDREYRTVILDIADYKRCLDFALAQDARAYVASDFGSGRQREFGQKITNWVKGQLGEIAVKKFFKEKFGTDVELDFEIRDSIVPQDITAINEKGKARTPRIGVGIKSSKPKSVYLVLGSNEIELPERRSDVYIFCRPDLPDDHLLRLTRDAVLSFVKGEAYYETYKNEIPVLTPMPCEIVGYCEFDKLEPATEIPGQKFESGHRYVIKTGLLKHSPVDWRKLIGRL